MRPGRGRALHGNSGEAGSNCANRGQIARCRRFARPAPAGRRKGTVAAFTSAVGLRVTRLDGPLRSCATFEVSCIDAAAARSKSATFRVSCIPAPTRSAAAVRPRPPATAPRARKPQVGRPSPAGRHTAPPALSLPNSPRTQKNAAATIHKRRKVPLSASAAATPIHKAPKVVLSPPAAAVTVALRAAKHRFRVQNLRCARARKATEGRALSQCAQAGIRDLGKRRALFRRGATQTVATAAADSPGHDFRARPQRTSQILHANRGFRCAGARHPPLTRGAARAANQRAAGPRRRGVFLGLALSSGPVRGRPAGRAGHGDGASQPNAHEGDRPRDGAGSSRRETDYAGAPSAKARCTEPALIRAADSWRLRAPPRGVNG